MLEDSVVNEATKRLKIEERLQQALARSEKSCGHYKKRFKNLLITYRLLSSFGFFFIAKSFGCSTSSIKRFGGRDSLFGRAAILNFGHTERA